MNRSLCCVLLLFISLNNVNARAKQKKFCFPKYFKFGVATAAYQIEGAWNISDKSESIWDRYTHDHPERVVDHSNGDVATDSYHLYKEDVKMLQELGVQYYRFSISWSRLLPTGFNNKISKDGYRYYSDLIDELLKNNIKPLITMHHDDLPQSLQDLGGWTNPIMAEYFVDYAQVLFEEFGDRVKGWITFNEPYTFCLQGYGGLDAPGAQSSGIESYMCGHNILRAHGMVYRLYEAEYKSKQKGFVTITLDFSWIESASEEKRDTDAAERARQFAFGWFAHPIYSKEGDYPPVMRQRIDENSRRQGYHRSRLPTFTAKEIQMIKGSYDVLGLNSYTTYSVLEGDGKTEKVPSFYNDVGVDGYNYNVWPGSNSTWLKVVPWGFRKVLNWIRVTYDNPPVVITENGVSTPPGLTDYDRLVYMDEYLRNLHMAIEENNCNVRGYTYWSLLDNFEWLRGYSERFGLYEVDFKSPNKTRTARLSSLYYAQLARTKCIPTAGDVISMTQKIDGNFNVVYLS